MGIKLKSLNIPSTQGELLKPILDASGGDFQDIGFGTTIQEAKSFNAAGKEIVYVITLLGIASISVSLC